MLEAEQEFIEKAKAGDGTAFGRLYEHYVAQIYRFIALKVGTRQLAEDLTHEVFMSAWQKLPNFTQQGFPFSSWLYKIARNRVIDHYRTQKALVSIDEEVAINEDLFAASSRSDELFDQGLAVKKIETAMKELTSEQQEVLTLRFVNDLTPREIAEILNKREGTIRIIQHRATNKLKKILGKSANEK